MAKLHAQPRVGCQHWCSNRSPCCSENPAIGIEDRKGVWSPALVTCRDVGLHGAGHPLGESQQKKVSHQYLTLAYALFNEWFESFLQCKLFFFKLTPMLEKEKVFVGSGMANKSLLQCEAAWGLLCSPVLRKALLGSSNGFCHTEITALLHCVPLMKM